MKILGIDPGLNITGYGVLEKGKKGPKVIEAGTIKTSTKQTLPERLNTIYSQITQLIKDTNPHVCVIEKLYSHFKHPMTSVLMAHARGAIVLAANLQNLKLIDYPAKTVKRAITGNGNASKEQVRRAIEGFLDLQHSNNPLDITDALALSLTHIYHNQNAELINQ